MSHSDEMKDQEHSKERELQIEAIVSLCCELCEDPGWCELDVFGEDGDNYQQVTDDVVTDLRKVIRVAPRGNCLDYIAAYIAAGVVLIRGAPKQHAMFASCATFRALERVHSYQEVCKYVIDAARRHDDVDNLMRLQQLVNSDQATWQDEQFQQMAADVMWGYVLGCIVRLVYDRSQQHTLRSRVKCALDAVHSNEVLKQVKSRIKYLRDCYKAQGRKRRQRVLMIALCGAIACGMGMVLPMCWGALFPWALQVWGAVVGGLLGYKAACAEPSAGGVVLMLVGWALTSLATGCLLWGVWPLIASYSAALATVMGVASTALCVGGAGSLWSKRIERGECGQRHPPNNDTQSSGEKREGEVKVSL